jgi:hypothetical protein
VACGNQKREVQTLLEFNDGISDAVVPMWGVCPTPLRNVVGLNLASLRV